MKEPKRYYCGNGEGMFEDSENGHWIEYSEHKSIVNSLLELINGSFGIAANANDFFEYSCSEMVLIDAQDLEWVLPIFQKYGWKGIEASMAYIAKKKPIKSHITKEFEEAYAEIEKINPEVQSEY